MAFTSSLLSVCPKIRAGRERLVASTRGWVVLVTLGLWIRSVVVDRESRKVTVERWMGWVFYRRTVLTFSEIMSVTYGYQDLSILSWLSLARDPIDRFMVGLQAAGRDEVILFSFVGEGTFTNGGDLPDWWYWEEYSFDWRGTQEGESRLYANLVAQMIGVPVGPSSLS